MKENLVIKWILIICMISLSVLSFSQITKSDMIFFRVFMILSGLFFIYQAIWIFRLKIK